MIQNNPCGYHGQWMYSSHSMYGGHSFSTNTTINPNVNLSIEELDEILSQDFDNYQ